jgi:hypothetical protein
MKTQRAPFQPLSADTDIDEKIENLAREKGVGALVKQGPGPPTQPGRRPNRRRWRSPRHGHP